MNTRHSGVEKRNPKLHDWTRRFSKKSNRHFLAAALERLAEPGDSRTGRMSVVLVGQRDLPGVTLRRSQAILRWDLRPSLWSHALLIAQNVAPTPRAVPDARIREVALHSRTGVFPDPAHNAVTDGTLRCYDDPEVDANIAVLSVEMSEAECRKVAARAADPNRDRLRYDLWATLGVWQSYFWSAGVATNPLRESVPMFSAAFVEYCFEAIQLDLAPAASDRNSAPEHLWNAAVWWHEELGEIKHQVSGYYVIRDPKCTLLDPA